MTVALHFNEDIAAPYQIERITFEGILQTVPDWRQDLRISIGTLLVGQLANSTIWCDDVAAEILSDKTKRLWTTFTPHSLTAILSSMNVAVCVLDGQLSSADVENLDGLLRDYAPIYVGSSEVSLEESCHQKLYHESLFSQYRIAKGSLHILHSALDVVNDDNRPYNLYDHWRQTNLFNAVDWESTGVRGTYLEAYISPGAIEGDTDLDVEAEEAARNFLEGYFASQGIYPKNQ